MDDSTGSDLGDSCGILSINVGIDEVVRGIGADIKHSHPLGGVGLIVVDGLVSVHVLARGLVIVDGIGLVLWPNRVHEVFLILQVSPARSLSDTVERVAVQGVGLEEASIDGEVSINQETKGVRPVHLLLILVHDDV